MKVKTNYVPWCSDEYLTPGKVYDMSSIEDFGDGPAGVIICDDGTEAYICLRSSAHIDGRAWEIVE